jgi:hypothetical protein
VSFQNSGEVAQKNEYENVAETLLYADTARTRHRGLRQ